MQEYDDFYRIKIMNDLTYKEVDPVGYVFTLFILVVIGVVCYRIFKKKSVPSNQYTPYDDITIGKKIDIKRENPLHDTKHQIQYEEKITHNKKEG